MKRDTIKIRSVRAKMFDGIGYLRVTTFSEQTTSGLTKEIDEMFREHGDKLQGFVLDLRNNPGGLLSEAISVSDAFLEQGEIVSTRGRSDENASRAYARPGDIAKGLPVVVLINSGISIGFGNCRWCAERPSSCRASRHSLVWQRFGPVSHTSIRQ